MRGVSRRWLVRAGLVAALGVGVGAGGTALVLATTTPALVKGGQLATLSWYANNYATGSSPLSVATDGANVWTCNYTSVTKVAIATNTVVGTYSTGVGSNCYGIAFDGTSIWTANFNSASVTKMNPSTGAVIGTYALPASSSPYGILFDGTSIWVANSGTSAVSKVNPSTGAVIGTYALPASSGPRGIAFDGTSIWTANYGTSAVSKINPSTGAVIGTYALPAGSQPFAIAFDQPGYSTNPNFLDPKTYVWTANYGISTVSKIDTATGTVVGTYPAGTRPSGIVFDGTSIWVTNGDAATVTRIQAR